MGYPFCSIHVIHLLNYEITCTCILETNSNHKTLVSRLSNDKNMEYIYKFTIVLERKPTSILADLAGFHADPLSWSNWNLEMLGFVEGGKPENAEENPWSKARINNKLNPHIALGQN